MASTYSTNLAIELIGTGDQAGTWGNTTNTNLGTLIEQAISGYVTQAVSTGTDTTITIPNGATGVARNMYIELTGTGGASTNLIVPSNKKLYFIFNNSTGAVTVKVSGQTGVSVPQGKKMVLTSNGTDVVNGLNYIADFASNSATITHLSATSATITNLTLTSLVISNLSIASANITNLTATSLTVSSGSTLNGGVVINEPGADADTRIEGDTDANLFFADASTDRIGVGTNAPLSKFQVAGQVRISGVSTGSTALVIPAGDILSDVSSGAFAIGNYGDASSEMRISTRGFTTFRTGATVGTDGTEQMRLTSTGLGIGTSSPVGKVHAVASTAGTTSLFERSTASTAVPVFASRSLATSSGDMADGFGPTHAFAIQDGAAVINPISEIGAVREGADNSGALVFRTYSAGTATTQMRLDSSGNLIVGGTSAPLSAASRGNVTINGSSTAIMNLTIGGTNKGYIFHDDSAMEVWNADNSDMKFATNNTERARITSGGDFGIGTSTPGTKLHVTGSNGFFVQFLNSTNNTGEGIAFGSGTNLGRISSNGASTALTLETNGSERARITSGGNFGIGDTGPSSKLQVAGDIRISGAGSSIDGYDGGFLDYSSSALRIRGQNSTGGVITFMTSANGAGNISTERARITSDGNLGVGTTSPQARLMVGGSADFPVLKISRSDASYNSGILSLGDGNGTTNNVGIWRGAANSVSSGGNVMNVGGYDGIVFTAGNAALGSQTERARITSGGNFLVQKTTSNNTDTGINWIPNDYLVVTNNATSSGDRVLMVNRQNSDGTLVEFRQENVNEGTISVSGSTVSYNGGHLSRWSQFSDGSHPDLVKGTVMTNLDQMAVWINPETGEPEENEQLNCMKVSDVEGDPNVAGVFVNWDGESDLNIAMTGDMIIRIAQGVVVQRGDLLMSAGDGTAKPQGDDIRRSKTVAKVTSNHVTCTYEDGSYCVPCVLMAC